MHNTAKQNGFGELATAFTGPTIEITEHTIAKIATTIKNLKFEGNKPRRLGILDNNTIILLFDDRSGYVTSP